MGRLYRTCSKLAMVGFVLAIPAMLMMGCSNDDKGTGSSNKAPTITSVSATPSSVSPGGSATVMVVASDPDGDALTYTYAPTGGSITGSGPAVTWTLPSTAGAYSVMVTVSDGSLTATSQAGVTVLQPATQVIGTLTLVPGDPGDVRNSQVALYATLADWLNYAPFKFVGASGSQANIGSYVLTPVPAGTAYIDSWRDNDNTGDWSSGDLVGWYGAGGLGSPALTPFSIVDGETKTINMTMQTIP